jgi:hypothetical protein
MASTTLTSLNNGIMLASGETILGVIPSTGTYAGYYLYWTSLGNVYLQMSVATATYTAPVTTSAAGVFTPTAGGIEYISINSAYPLPTETWTITFTSATTFDVSGSISGAVGSACDITWTNPVYDLAFAHVLFSIDFRAWSGTWATSDTVVFDIAPAASSVLVTTASFAITCASLSISPDYSAFDVFLGGASGNYVFGTIDFAGTPTVSALTYGTDNFTAVGYDTMLMQFVIGTNVGTLVALSTDPVTLGAFGTFTALGSLLYPSRTLGVGETIVVSRICYDLTDNNYLILGTSSTNVNSAAGGNYSVLYYGTTGGTALADTTKYEPITGKNLWLGAVGHVENASGVRVLKLVAAGELSQFYSSDTGASGSWTAAIAVGAGTLTSSLTFNTWVFAAGLPTGQLLLSTNGTTWDLADLSGLGVFDVVDVEAS